MFVPNIDTLRSKFGGVSQQSSFDMRGDAIQNGFARRFGGGFYGTNAVAESFRDDMGDMVKKVVTTDSKTINSRIGSAIGEKIQEEVKPQTSTYTKPEETIAQAQMSTDQAQEFLSNMVKNQDSARRAMTPGLIEDSGMRNVAAALKTTEDTTFSGLGQFGIDPELLKNLQSLNLSGFTGVGGSSTYMPPTEQIAAELPAIIDNIPELTATEPEPTPPPEVPQVSQEFNDLIGEVFNNKQEVPEDYKLSKMDVTYTKVTPPPSEEDDYDEVIDSIDVVGKKIDLTGDDEQIDSIDVVGKGGRRGSQEDQTDSRQQYAEADSEDYGGDSPWERFKRLYFDFYGGEDAGSLLKEYNKRESSGAYNSKASMASASANLSGAGYINKDASDILKAKTDKDQMMAFSESMKAPVDKNQQQQIVITNNKMYSTKDGDSKTGKVFTDDSTFNRLAMYDSNHPQYSGYRG